MGIYAELNTNPSRRDLARFGNIVGVWLGALAAWFYFRAGRPLPAIVLASVAFAVFLLARIPPIGRILYIAWMGIGLTLGTVTAPIVMMVVYTTVIVPVALWFKLRGRDALHLRRDGEAGSYWEDYPQAKGPASYLRQY